MRLLPLAACGLLLFAAGCCRDTGPARYEVRGGVTHGGAPIPAGQIVFEPDGQQGNTGPQGIAEIENGTFQTLSDRGSVPGPAIVTIRGHSGVPHPEDPRGLPLFPPYRTRLEIPAENSTHQIDVPATHTFESAAPL